MDKFEMDNLRALAARIANSDSPAEALALFRFCAPLLAKCKIVLAAERGTLPGSAVNRSFAAGAAVRSLFHSDRVLVLDTETVREMANGRAIFPIDYSISLDTQAMSYLEPFLHGQLGGGLPKDFKEVFDFIARDDVFVDPLPYCLENLRNLDKPEAADRIFAKLKAYEVLRNIDSQWLRTHGEVRCTLTEQELTKRAQEHIARMCRNRADDSVMKTLHFRHQTMYCQLLKMVLIQLRSPSWNVERKIEEFAVFQDSTLSTIGAREMVVARAYFESGQKLTFFGKMQKGHERLFANIDGMAWDLWHVRQLEESLALRPSTGARYFFPALLTFDKRLIEIIDLYPLKACAFMEGDSEPVPVFDGDFLQVIAGTPEAQDDFYERFYSAEARASRDLRREGVKAGGLGSVVKGLEDELSAVAGVPKPNY